MKDSSPHPILRMLLGAACIIIILCGVKAASAVLGPLLLSLLIAYAVVPFPKWLMSRFKLHKSWAIALTAVAVVAFGLYLLLALDLATIRIAAKLPIYEERLAGLYQQIEVSMNTHNIIAPSLSIKTVFTPERLRELSRAVLPEAGSIISNGLLIGVLAFLFIIEMAGEIGAQLGPLAEKLAYDGSDARSYVAVTARTAGINALINLVFLIVMGVDTPVVWSFLYFFLDFIPTLGFVIALIPPTFVTLLMYGWKRALLVAGGLILTNLIVDNVITPIFMKHAVDVSVLDITLSLVIWAFLLGLTGAILAIPLTLALRKFVAKNSDEPEPALNLSG
ncbi:MAG TPA: AI-2E family transporter [Candidatus Acidoferrum sp.]|jgi:AI-2 transport protein TqsA|nr:AI-2E family transporter [Candidatus Acidoferrum sp.]